MSVTNCRRFFPSVYYLSTSKVAIAVLGNFAFAVALCTYFLLTKVTHKAAMPLPTPLTLSGCYWLYSSTNRRWLQIFLGTLREAEVERINQRISQAIIETCLAMTIFRDEFNVKFVALFTVLSFIKVFHWLVQDRYGLLLQQLAVLQVPASELSKHTCLTLLVSEVLLDANIAARLAIRVLHFYPALCPSSSQHQHEEVSAQPCKHCRHAE